MQRQCLIKIDISQYVALNYVWGNPVHDFVVTSKEKVSSLSEVGSLVMAKLPQTVLDAMEVCRQLGERYLWVDSLCIIQDDENDILSSVEAMASIYSEAHFVIIAAHGNDMTLVSQA